MRPFVWVARCRATLAANPGLIPFRRVERAVPRPLFGLAPGGVCRAPRVATRAVRSYRTVSPLPDPAARPPPRLDCHSEDPFTGPKNLAFLVPHSETLRFAQGDNLTRRRPAAGRPWYNTRGVRRAGDAAARPARAGRKVRTPQGTVVANGDRSQDQGKCNREQTADGPPQVGVASGCHPERSEGSRCAEPRKRDSSDP